MFEISEKLPFSTSTFELELELESQEEAGGFALELSNSKNDKLLIGYDADRKQYFIDRTQAGETGFSEAFPGIHYGPRIPADANFPIKILVDVASVELFADGGKTVMTEIFFPEEELSNIRLLVDKGPVKIKSGSLKDIESIWNNRPD